MTIIRLLGPIRGKLEEYVETVKGQEYSLQLGDFSEEGYPSESAVNHDRHKFIAGDEETFGDGSRQNWPRSFLGDYGQWEIGKSHKIFFCRGMPIFDVHMMQYTFTTYSELDYVTMGRAIEEYSYVRPTIMFTHSPPAEIEFLMNDVYAEHRTGQMLQSMFAQHQPLLWAFGHCRKGFRRTLHGTMFVGLKEMEAFDLSL